MDQEIIKRIGKAKRLYDEYAWIILSNKQISAQIDELSRIIKKRKDFMYSCGISQACKRCDMEEAGGSCCGKGIELRYDEYLLLINLLLGCALPEKRYEPNSCFFLGKEGCVLNAAHVICINYLCKDIENTIPKSLISQLRDIEGEMVILIFKLHEYLKKYISELGLTKKTLYRVAQFYDNKKVGEDGRFGFRRSSDLMTIYRCLEALMKNKIIRYKESIFLDIGCADARVNIFFSYITKLSIGIEIDDWSLDESKELLNQLVSVLKKEKLLLPGDNIHLYHGDVFDPSIYRKIKEDTGFGIEEFDVFYTYLFMYEEFADIIREKGKDGAIFIIYGIKNIVPQIKGFAYINDPSFPENIAIYRKF